MIFWKMTVPMMLPITETSRKTALCGTEAMKRETMVNPFLGIWPAMFLM